MEARVVKTRIDLLSPDLEKRVTRLTHHLHIWTPEYQIWVWRVISTYSSLASTPDLGLASQDASNSHELATPDPNLPSFSIQDNRDFPRSGVDESMRVSTTRENWFNSINNNWFRVRWETSKKLRITKVNPGLTSSALTIHVRRWSMLSLNASTTSTLFIQVSTQSTLTIHAST